MVIDIRQVAVAILILLCGMRGELHAQQSEPTTSSIGATPPATFESGVDEDPRDVFSAEQWNRVDDAIESALAWLAGQQQRDGSFPTLESGQPGVTSLCGLAFLAQGHGPDDGEYGQCVQQAIDYVTRCQKPNGLLSLVGPVGQIEPNSEFRDDDVPASYNHAISSLMLSEAYGMRKAGDQDRMRPAIDAALRLSLELQSTPKRDLDKGGWRYFSRYGRADSDLSITSWYLMSLRSARNAGFNVPEQPIDQAMAYVVRCFSPDDATFTYSTPCPHRPMSRAMAGAGVLALAHGGRHHSIEAHTAGDWLLQHPFRGYNQLEFQKDSYHYGMFYTCQAMYQLGGEHWRSYFPTAAEQLLSNQGLDGSWQADANGNERIFGQCYTTALGVLALSAGNQLLPIFQR